MHHRNMLPDPGCYEERYRPTRGAALRLALGLLSLGLGLRWQSLAISATAVILAIPVVLSALAVLFAAPGVIALACRMIAFRADYAGITLGGLPTSLAALRSPATFIPWAEVDKIIVYPARFPGPGRPGEARPGEALPGPGLSGLGLPGPGLPAPVRGIAIQRRDGAAALLPGTATRTARTITGWRLDRERLAAVTAAVAPGIPVVRRRSRHRPVMPPVAAGGSARMGTIRERPGR